MSDEPTRMTHGSDIDIEALADNLESLADGLRNDEVSVEGAYQNLDARVDDYVKAKVELRYSAAVAKESVLQPVEVDVGGED